MKYCFKFTLILLFLFVNSVGAQIKPSTSTERFNGLEKRKLLEKDTSLNSIRFKNVGPSIMSGRVTDVDVNPADPTEFYVAYASGGLWYTANNGHPWCRCSTKRMLSVSAILPLTGCGEPFG